MTYTGPLTSPRSPRPGEPLPLIKTNADADDSAYGHQLSKTNLTVRSGASISGAGAVGGVSANARKVVRWGGDDDEPEVSVRGAVMACVFMCLRACMGVHCFKETIVLGMCVCKRRGVGVGGGGL